MYHSIILMRRLSYQKRAAFCEQWIRYRKQDTRAIRRPQDRSCSNPLHFLATMSDILAVTSKVVTWRKLVNHVCLRRADAGRRARCATCSFLAFADKAGPELLHHKQTPTFLASFASSTSASNANPRPFHQNVTQEA